MKVTVIKYLNVRVGSPSVNAPCFQYLAPGSVLDVDGKIYKGDPIDGVDTWLKDELSNYYWTGGFEKTTLISNIKSDPLRQWWLKNYSIPNIWALGISGNGIKIAVLDTGISFPHPDLNLDNSLFFDATQSPSGTNDARGHGTHCAGIIKASDNGIGVTGIAYAATIYPGKITHDEYGDDKTYLKKGLEWAINSNVDIISISNGSPVDPGAEIEMLIKAATAKGILIVCAAGNKTAGSPDNHIYFPARYADCLSVGALDENKLPITSSILTGETMVFAPGKDILSTYKNSGYITLTGSSQAAPFVSGVCALALESKRKVDKNFKAWDLKPLLISSAESLPFGKVINPMNFLT